MTNLQDLALNAPVPGGGGGGGGEIAYAQITSPANVTDTSESTATSLISPGAVTFDGNPVIVTFFTVSVTPPNTVGGFIVITLFEGSTQITRLAFLTNVVVSQQEQNVCCCQYRFTPTAGSHTYKICAYTNSTSGTPAIVAGSGGTSGWAPAFVRFASA